MKSYLYIQIAGLAKNEGVFTMKTGFWMIIKTLNAGPERVCVSEDKVVDAVVSPTVSPEVKTKGRVIEKIKKVSLIVFIAVGVVCKVLMSLGVIPSVLHG